MFRITLLLPVVSLLSGMMIIPAYGLEGLNSLNANFHLLLDNEGELLDHGECPNNDKVVVWKDRQWQSCGSEKKLNLKEAIAYCENLSVGEYQDWRLPTKSELKELVVCTNGTPTPFSEEERPFHCGDKNLVAYDSPTISPIFYSTRGGYWSSTVVRDHYMFAVHFKRGQGFNYPNYIKINVRCTR